MCPKKTTKAKRKYVRKAKPEPAKTTDVIIPASKEQVIREVYAKGLDDSEWEVFKMVCAGTRLNPVKKQIIAVKRWDSKLQKDVMTPQTTIDGYRAIAARTGLYAGQDDAIFEHDAQGNVVKATVTVYKMVQGQRVPFTATAYTKEYKPKEGQDFMWKTKEHVMIAKCAEALAHRKAFPEDTAGVYIEEEMQKADVLAATTDAKYNDDKIFAELQAAKNLSELNMTMIKFQNRQQDYILSCEGWSKALVIVKEMKVKLTPKAEEKTVVDAPVFMSKEKMDEYIQAIKNHHSPEGVEDLWNDVISKEPMTDEQRKQLLILKNETKKTLTPQAAML